MTNDIAKLSFEAALEELDGLITKLEGGQIDLADAVEAYRRGTELAAHCAQLLDRTEATITQLVAGPAGVAEVPLTNSGPAAPRARSVGAPGVLPGIGVSASSETPVDPDDIPF